MVRPTGTVTFLFTDVEQSTQRWERDPDVMSAALAAHDRVLADAVEANGGWLFKHTGDGICAAFASPGAAAETAVQAQRALALPVRMGIASGEAEQRGDDYFGSTLNGTARVMACGHGGQILVAGSTAGLLRSVDLRNIDLRDLGSHRLRGLTDAVHLYQLEAHGLRHEFPPLSTAEGVAGNLPALTDALVGRDEAIASLVALLQRHRLVTLTGVGGVGKTVLAMAAAASARERFHDGVWVVELASVLESDAVAEAVASAFNAQVQVRPDRPDVVVEVIGGRHVLLVLDNCEHVLDGVASVVDAVMARCPGVTILATSREAVGVPTELAWPVPSLQLGIAAPASVLFFDRARMAAIDYVPGAGDPDVVAEICARLDGIPLAIELAAARVRSMNPTQIRDRLAERFRLLTGSRRAVERHQTLRHAVQWSYDLLNEAEQRALQCCSTFADGFALPAATAVCSADPDWDLDELDTLDVLDSLVRKSLLRVERRDRDVRYSLLETIRQFAEERLVDGGRSGVVRDGHATWFARQAEREGRRFVEGGEKITFLFIEDEMANLHAAFRWSVAKGLTDAAVLIAAHTHYPAQQRLRTDSVGWAEEALPAARASNHRLLPQLLSVAADAAFRLGRFDDAKRLANDAIALLGDERFETNVWMYITLGIMAAVEGDPAASVGYLRTGADHPADARVGRPVLSSYVSMTMRLGVRLPDAEFEAAIAAITAVGIPTFLAQIPLLRFQRDATGGPSDTATLLRLYEEAIGRHVSSGNRFYEMRFRADQLAALARTSDPRQALNGYRDLVRQWQVNGDQWLTQGMATLIELLAGLGHARGAAMLVGTLERAGARFRTDVRAVTSMLHRALGDVELDAAVAAGGALSYRAAGDLAMELIDRSLADLG